MSPAMVIAVFGVPVLIIKAFLLLLVMLEPKPGRSKRSHS